MQVDAPWKTAGPAKSPNCGPLCARVVVAGCSRPFSRRTPRSHLLAFAGFFALMRSACRWSLLGVLPERSPLVKPESNLCRARAACAILPGSGARRAVPRQQQHKIVGKSICQIGDTNPRSEIRNIGTSRTQTTLPRSRTAHMFRDVGNGVSPFACPFRASPHLATSDSAAGLQHIPFRLIVTVAVPADCNELGFTNS